MGLIDLHINELGGRTQFILRQLFFKDFCSFIGLSQKEL